MLRLDESNQSTRGLKAIDSIDCTNDRPASTSSIGKIESPGGESALLIEAGVGPMPPVVEQDQNHTSYAYWYDMLHGASWVQYSVPGTTSYVCHTSTGRSTCYDKITHTPSIVLEYDGVEGERRRSKIRPNMLKFFITGTSTLECTLLDSILMSRGEVTIQICNNINVVKWLKLLLLCKLCWLLYILRLLYRNLLKLLLFWLLLFWFLVSFNFLYLFWRTHIWYIKFFTHKVDMVGI